MPVSHCVIHISFRTSATTFANTLSIIPTPKVGGNRLLTDLDPLVPLLSMQHCGSAHHIFEMCVRQFVPSHTRAHFEYSFRKDSVLIKNVLLTMIILLVIWFG